MISEQELLRRELQSYVDKHGVNKVRSFMFWDEKLIVNMVRGWSCIDEFDLKNLRFKFKECKT